jgi:hypothetical protein
VTKRSGSVTLGPLPRQQLQLPPASCCLGCLGACRGSGRTTAEHDRTTFQNDKKETTKKFPVWLGGRFAQGVYPWSTLVNENGRRGFTSPTQI